MDELKKAAEETKQTIIDSFLEAGDALDREAVDARVRDLLGVEETRKQVMLLKDIMGVDLAQAALIVAGDFESAGTTMEDAMKAVQGASSDVDFTVFQNLLNTMNATNDAFVTGTDLAKAREDAAKRTGEAERTQIQMTRDADQTRWELYAASRNAMTAPVTQQVNVQLNDTTNYWAWRASVQARLGSFTVPVQMGPGIGRQMVGP
jgi:hypothetical protein